MRYLPLIILFALSAGAADWTWTGTQSSDWSNKSNWTTVSLASVPGSGDTVILAAGTVKPTNQNIANLSIFKIVIPPGIQTDTVISGQKITLGAGGLDFQNAPFDFTIAAPIELAAQQRWTIAAGRTLYLSGAIAANLAVWNITGTTSVNSKQVANVNDPTGVVAGMPISGAAVADTWIESISGTTLTLTRLAELTRVDTPLQLTPCWILDSNGTVDISAVDASNFTAPILAKSGTVRFRFANQLKGGVLLGNTATLELKANSGVVSLALPVVSLGALVGGQSGANAPALLVHAGDALSLPAAPGVALTGDGGGTQNVFRLNGAGSVTFTQADAIPAFATSSLRLESGTTEVNSLSLQPSFGFGKENGVIEFHGNSTLRIRANANVATTAANGVVTPQIAPNAAFVSRYGSRQVSAMSGTSDLLIDSGALFQNNLRPADENVLVAAGAVLRVSGADDTAIFRIGRDNSEGATSATLNTGRFDLRGGQCYFHAAHGTPPYRVFPSQAGFTLALNGGVFNGERCDDFLGNLTINDAPAGLARIDNFKLAGTGTLHWGAGVLEKVNVVNDLQGHDSSQRQHELTFEKPGGTVQVVSGAALRISAGSVLVNGINPFADDAVPDRYVAIENNATLQLAGSDKIFGTLSGIKPLATIRLDALNSTSFSAETSTYAGRFEGFNTFVKSGPGTLRLTGDNSSFQGRMRIQNGVLVADNAVSATGSQTVQVNNNGTLAGAGKIIGAIDLDGTLAPGRVPFSAGDNTLDTGNLNLHALSTLRFTLNNSPATGSAVAITGNVVVNGGALHIVNGGGFTTGEYPLVTYSGALSGDFTQLSIAEMPAGFSGKLMHDSANKAIVLRVFVPPVSSISQPALNLYRAATWPGMIAGSVVDTNGVGLASVEVSLRRDTGEYFGGTGFSSNSEVWIPAAVAALNWSLAFPVTNFAADGVYTLRVRATDNAGNAENPPAQRSVTIDRLAPIVTVNALSTPSASPALSGTVNDPNATILVSVNGSSATAQNNGSTWTLAAGTLPGMTAGVYDVAVQATDLAGNTGADTSASELSITLPDISVSLVAPTTGSAAGGTLVTLSGTNLDLVTVVKFGTVAGVIQSKSSGSVKVVTPEHDAGIVAITVESLSNTLVLNNAFNYFNPPPSIATITPARVSTNGGTQISVLGAGFLAGAVVQVNGKAAVDVVRVSAKIVTARVPANPPGPAAVTVVNPDNNAVSLPNAVTYDQPPQLSSAPQLSSSQVQVGAPVQVLFGFFDPEGGAVSYSVDWGDGSSPGQNTFHTYASAGVYTIVLTGSDGIGTSTHTLSVTVTGQSGGGGAPTPEPSGGLLRIDALSGAIRFDLAGRDVFKLSGVFPALPAGTTFANVECVVAVGGASERFELNAKGKGKTAAGTLTLRIKFSKNRTTRLQEYNGAAIPVSVSVKGAFADFWLDENLRPNGGSAGVSEPFAVSVTIGAVTADGAVVANTAVRAGKSGKFSFKRSR